MQIVISAAPNGKFAIRTSLGHYTEADTHEQARIYARGLVEGWDMARRSLHAASWRSDVEG